MPGPETPADGTRPDDPSTALADLAAEVWDADMAGQPVFATSLGDRRFDDRLRPNGPGAIAAEIDRANAFVRRAEAIDPGSLGAGDRVTRAALIDHIERERDIVASGIEAWAVD